MKRASYFLLILLPLLAGCGFKLRGAIDVPSYLHRIYISPNCPYEPLQVILRKRFRELGITTVDNKAAAHVILQLSPMTTSEEILARGPSGQVIRLRFNARMDYSFNYAGKSNAGRSSTITRARELSVSNNLMLSNESEKRSITEELMQELVFELLRQLASQPPSKD